MTLNLLLLIFVLLMFVILAYKVTLTVALISLLLFVIYMYLYISTLNRKYIVLINKKQQSFITFYNVVLFYLKKGLALKECIEKSLVLIDKIIFDGKIIS